MSIDLEREVEEVQLTFAFRELKMDDLVVLACGIARYTTIEQMEANIGRMLGYGAEEASTYCVNLAKSVIRLMVSQHLEHYDGNTHEGLGRHILTEKGRQRKMEIFNNFVDKMPKPVRKELLKREAMLNENL